MSTQKTAKLFGTWTSPITAEFIADQATVIEDVLVDSANGTVYHVEKRSSEQGRNSIVRTDNAPRDLLPSPWDVRTGVHTYGGTAAAIFNDTVVLSNGRDSRVYALKGNADVVACTPDNNLWRYGDFTFYPKNPNIVLSIREDHTRPEPANVVNTLVCVQLDDPSKVKVVASGQDFYSSACFSPDGTRVAWLQWNHPEVPAQSAELVVAEVTSSNDSASITFTNSRIIAGEHGKTVAQQPTWISNTQLLFVCDKSGWLSPWTYDTTDEKGARPALSKLIEEDFGEPAWFLGSSSYAVLDTERSIWSSFRNGISTICMLHLSSGIVTDIPVEYKEIRRMRRIDDSSVVFIAKSSTQPDFLVKLTFSGAESSPNFTILKESAHPVLQTLISEYFSIAQPLELQDASKRPIYTLFYLPTNPQFIGVGAELPPCIVNLHGGPSSRQGAGFEWMHQYFTSRGWAWLDVNYGGSTGHGRAYMERMYGQWGEIDIKDTVSAVKEIQRRGLVDPRRVVIRGNSAGGYSTLRSLCAYPDFYQGGISCYGVSDVKRLVESTHKFQMCYIFKLQGGTPEEIPDVYKARSPVYTAGQIKAPLLILQGDTDFAVPASQAELIVDTIKAQGGKVDYVLFEGEGHGWTKSSTIQVALEKQMAFAMDVIGI
ncbi:alpha/beta-hydrolase [Crucibulum laeve]|uniref:Alpha/beta-hydrolase n=1 Tax=Crucibulum laeve TaxID=68775 RepID=A0A5C3M1L0_9AGAR|nr:alpha/beta-hydrolase [Crucibulum laeve]